MSTTGNPLFRGEIYYKESTLKSLKTWLVIAEVGAALPLFLATVLSDSPDALDDSLFVKVYGVLWAILFAVTQFVRYRVRYYKWKGVSDTSWLVVANTHISFYAETILLSDIKRMDITISSRKAELLISENNLLEIETFYSKYRLGLMIHHYTELRALEECINVLRKRGINIVYEDLSASQR